MEAILSSLWIAKNLQFEYDILMIPQYVQMPSVSQEREEGLD